MPISDKVQQNLLKSSWIRAMFEEGEKLKKIHGSDKVFDFTLGNPITEPPARFREKLLELASSPPCGMHKYMNNAGYDETRHAIAVKMSKESGIPIRKEDIVMTVGASGALNIIIKTIIDQGDEIIVLAPYFVEYIFYIDNHGGVPVIVDTKDDFQIDIQSIEKRISKKTKAIIINSPNNPTGTIYSSESLSQLQSMLYRKQNEFGTTIYVISDQPYSKIVYDDVKIPYIFNYIPNSIIATSHSKDLSLPGERIGYAVVNPIAKDHELLIEGMIFANRSLGFVNAPALMQRIITYLQNEDINISDYQEKRDLLYDNLTKFGFEMNKPQGAFYLFPKSPIPDDIEFVKTAQKYNILLVPGTGFGKPGYFRLAYCVEKDTIINSLDSFEKLATEFNLKK